MRGTNNNNSRKSRLGLLARGLIGLRKMTKLGKQCWRMRAGAAAGFDRFAKDDKVG